MKKFIMNNKESTPVFSNINLRLNQVEYKSDDHKIPDGRFIMIVRIPRRVKTYKIVSKKEDVDNIEIGVHTLDIIFILIGNNGKFRSLEFFYSLEETTELNDKSKLYFVNDMTIYEEESKNEVMISLISKLHLLDEIEWKLENIFFNTDFFVEGPNSIYYRFLKESKISYPDELMLKSIGFQTLLKERLLSN